MKTLKLNFTVPEDVATALRERVTKRQRSAFVAAAVRDKLHELEQAQLKRALSEGYQARREEEAAINGEWERPTLEAW